MTRRFVFLDRDGTLVHDVGYLHRLEDYRLLPGVREGLRALARAGFRFAIVTNQSGIGRGYYDVAAFDAFQARLVADLAACGIRIEASFFCPHLPDAGCTCRKPAPGLLHEAARTLDADLARSWVIGDRASDAELALRAGCVGAVLVAENGSAPASSEHARDLVEAAERIARAEGRSS